MLPRKLKQQESLTLRQIVDGNMSQKGASHLVARYSIKEIMDKRFREVYNPFESHFMAVPYIFENGDILFHVKVPSRRYKLEPIRYDVFFLLENSHNSILSKRPIKLFSNGPSFGYTYSYVFYHYGLMIDEFADLQLSFISQAPAVRNPVEEKGYEKSIYIAARYLMTTSALTSEYVSKHGVNVDEKIYTKLKRDLVKVEEVSALYNASKRREVKQKNIRRPISADESAQYKELKATVKEKDKATTYKKSKLSKAPKAQIKAKKAKKQKIK